LILTTVSKWISEKFKEVSNPFLMYDKNEQWISGFRTPVVVIEGDN
jgi:hypothetical protein